MWFQTRPSPPMGVDCLGKLQGAGAVYRTRKARLTVTAAASGAPVHAENPGNPGSFRKGTTSKVVRYLHRERDARQGNIGRRNQEQQNTTALATNKA